MINSKSRAIKILQSADKLNMNDADTAQAVKSSFKLIAKHYREDIKLFIEDNIKILDGATNEEMEFKLNRAQRRFLDRYNKSKYTAVPKARQLGMTTLTNALALHHSIFVDNASVIAMAYKLDNAQENLNRIRSMFDTIPAWLQNLLIKRDETHKSNVNVWTFYSRVTSTEASIETASASAEDALRGKTPTFLHWTETAFSDVAEPIFTAAYPALNRRKGSKIVLESTGNGNTGFYYEICTGVRKGFDVLFLAWYEEPSYTEELKEPLTELDKAHIADLMGQVDVPEHLTDGQLAWYRSTSDVMGKAKCQQEYPIDVSQVFQATNASFFSVKAMSKVEPQQPTLFFAFDDGYLSKKMLANGHFYSNVVAEHEYLMAVDPSEGQNDPTVITVYNPLGEEVMCWREKMPPEQVVELCDVLGRHWNNAKMVVERNGVGIYINKALVANKFYQNMYRDEKDYGFRTIPQNKYEMLSTLQAFITSGKLTPKNLYLRDEMSIVDATTLRAPKGKDLHDDTVMASAIAAYVFNKTPPKIKALFDTYEDYSYKVGVSKPSRRKFIF